jgi:hypothetical protein
MNTQQMIEALKIPSGYKKPTVGYPDGNAFAIFATVGRAVRKVDKELSSRYSSMAMKSDSYETVLGVATALVEFGDE